MTWWLGLAAAAAAAAALLITSAPASAVARMRAPTVRRPGRLPRWLAPVPGAPPLRRRVLLAAPAAAAITLAVGSFSSTDPRLLLGVMVVLTAMGAVALGRLESAQSRRVTAALMADLPQTWDLIAACLAAGLPLRSALAEVVAVVDGPLGELLGQVLTRVRLGEPEDQAWRSLGDHPLLGQPCRDLARSVSSGTGVAELLNEYAAQARDDQRAAAEAEAKAIGVRAVLPLMMCFLPAFFLIGIVPIIAGALLPLLSGW